MMNNNNNSPKRKLRKLLSGFLAVSTAVTMLGGQTTFFAGETNYSLAGEGSGEDVTIHFGGENQDINIHVNPMTETLAGFGAETDAETTYVETEAETEAETEFSDETETSTESGVKEVTDGALVTISAADESDLPEDAEANAEIVTGRKEAKAVDKVEKVEAEAAQEETNAPIEAETTALAGAGSDVQSEAEIADADITAQDVSSAAESAPTETIVVEQSEYQVFDIKLENVNQDEYEEGFKVQVTLPEEVIGRDFKLYHIHDGETEPIDVSTIGTTIDPETGVEVVSGFEFVTDGFSEFVLKYTVDFHYNGVDYSIPGNTQILLTQLIEIMHITVPENDEAAENGEVPENNEAPENGEAAENGEASDNGTLLDIHDVASVEFTDEHLVKVDQVSGIIIVNSVDGETTEVDAGDYNFLLSSLEPFSTDEKLTITLKDGTVIEVGVTDAQPVNVTIYFFESDGITPAPATSGGYNYIAAVNGNSVSGVSQIEVNDTSVTAKRLNIGNGYQLYLIQYNGDDLTAQYLSNSWWYEAPPVKIIEKTQLNGKTLGVYDVSKVDDANYKAVKKSGYTVNLEFMDHDYVSDLNAGNVIPGVTEGARAISGYGFVRVLLRNDEDAIVGYAIAPISTSEAVNTVILDQFIKSDNSGTISYSDAKDAGYSVPDDGVNVRVAYKDQNYAPTYQDFDNNSNGLSTADPDGYTFAGQERGTDERTVRLRMADPAEYYVQINCGNNPLTLPSDVDVYALVKADTSTTTLYAYAKVTAADTSDGGKTYRVRIPDTSWFQTKDWGNSYQQFSNQISGHEHNVTVSLAAVASGTTVNGPKELMYSQVPVAGSVQTHVVKSYPSIDNGNLSNPTQRTYVNVPGEKSTYTDYVYLEKNEDRFDLYTLEKILNGGYNVVTLCPGVNGSMPKSITEGFDAENVGPGDAYIGVHQMGGILIRGDVTFAYKPTGVADSPDADNPSVVGGYFGDTSPKGCFINARTNNNDSVNFYLGSSNSLITVKNGYTLVNGNQYGQELGGIKHGINYTGNTYVNDQFVDWNRLQSAMINSSKALLADATETIIAANGETVNVPLGSNVTISCPDNAYITVNIVGTNAEAPDAPGTVINFTNSNDARVPQLKVNGNGLQTSETGKGISVVWNFPNATGTINDPGTSEFGHVLAPKALIKILTGDYSGTMVGNNVYLGGNAEGHLYPYRGGQLVGFQAEIDTEKLVDGDTPLPIQRYNFDLYQLRNEIGNDEYSDLVGKYGTSDVNTIFWERIQTTRNVDRDIAFKDVNFYKAGKFYFIICEDQASVPDNMIGDTTRYLLECTVVSHQDGQDTILEMGGIQYYKVSDYENLITVSDTDDGKKAEIVGSAIESQGSLTFHESKINTLTVFENEEKKSGITIEKAVKNTRKTDDEFSFKLYVWYEGADSSDPDKTIYNAFLRDDVKTGSGDAVTFEKVTDYKADVTAESHEAGCTAFELTAASPITFVGLPEGVHYAFVEDALDPESGYIFEKAENAIGIVPAKGVASATVVFTNRYISAKAKIEGTKEFKNGTIAENQFSFTISSDDAEAPLPEDRTVYAQTDGSIAFGDMTYTMDMAKTGTKDGTIYTKTYTYKVVENAPDDSTFSPEDRTAGTKVIDGIKYDTSVETVTVTVTYDEASNEMRATVSPATTQFTFNNEQLGSVKVTKAFSGIANLPDGFKITASWREDGVDKTKVLTLSTEGMTGEGTTSNPYTWQIDNLPIGTEVTFTESGATFDGATLTITANGTAVDEGSTTATAKATSAKVEVDGEYPTARFVNEYKQTTDFEFSKIWKDIGNQPTEWPTGATITVKLNAYTDSATQTAVLQDQTLTFSPTSLPDGWSVVTSTDGKKATFKANGLPAVTAAGDPLTYYVVETQVSGYKAPSYATSDGDGLVFTGNDMLKATNGQQIINTPEGGYELPSTGGPGTRLFTILGSIMILGAGVLLWRRRRLI